MFNVGQSPPIFGVVPVVEAPSDLVDLLTATKVVNRELRNKELSPSKRVSVRFVLDELLELALELVAGGEGDSPPYSPERLFDDLPY